MIPEPVGGGDDDDHHQKYLFGLNGLVCASGFQLPAQFSSAPYLCSSLQHRREWRLSHSEYQIPALYSEFHLFVMSNFSSASEWEQSTSCGQLEIPKSSDFFLPHRPSSPCTWCWLCYLSLDYYRHVVCTWMRWWVNIPSCPIKTKISSSIRWTTLSCRVSLSRSCVSGSSAYRVRSGLDVPIRRLELRRRRMKITASLIMFLRVWSIRDILMPSLIDSFLTTYITSTKTLFYRSMSNVKQSVYVKFSCLWRLPPLSSTCFTDHLPNASRSLLTTI